MSAAPLHVVIHHDINRSGKAAVVITAYLDYPHPNIIFAFRSGSCRVPLHKLPALAKAIEVDPAELLRLGLAEYNPDLLSVIDGYLIHPS